MMGSIDKLLIDIFVYDMVAANSSDILGSQYDKIMIQSTTCGDNYYSTCDIISAHASSKMLHNNQQN